MGNQGRPSGPELRAAKRVAPGFRAFFLSGRSEGRGNLRDLSANGAFISDPEPVLRVGTKVTLVIELKDDGFTVKLAGKVVRQTDEGFAIEFFLDADPTMESFMGWVLRRSGLEEEPLAEPGGETGDPDTPADP